jgi:hypothetical protein
MNRELITALVDNEIKDPLEREEILTSIKNDKDLEVEYKIQSLVKSLVRERVKIQPTPDYVRERILKSITPKEVKREHRKFFWGEFFGKPAFTFATAVVVLFAIVLIILNRPAPVEYRNFALEQQGSNNMYVQAKNNFQSIVDGKLAPQLTSSNPEEIKNFFSNSGVKYSTLIPTFPQWNLVGAVVSEDNGEKFAHHVYADQSGKLVYLFQVDESYLQSHKIVSLSDDLLSYLDQGNCYTEVSDGKTTLLTKIDKNICAIVSNEDLAVLENTFCNMN